MKIKNSTKKKWLSFFKSIPYVVFYVVALSLLIGAGLVVIQLFISLFKSDSFDISIQVLVGIGATLLSLVIGITGLVTFIVSSVNSSSAKKRNQIEKTTSFIKEFNDLILDDLNIVSRILRSTSNAIKWKNSFDSLLVDQKFKYVEFNDFMKSKRISYKENLLYFIAEVMIVERNQINIKVSDFCEMVLKGRMENVGKYVSSRGAVQLFYIFKRKRISILNYFENLGICYINEMVDTDLVNEQFNKILQNIIPLLYYEIYRLEGLNSYPYLNKMLKIMQEK